MSYLPRSCVLSAIALASLLAGCSSSGPVAPSEVANPFVSGSGGAVQVHTLRAFGDSYTDKQWTDSTGTANWVELTRRRGVAQRTENYAIGGARAMYGEKRALDQQITTWEGKKSPIADRDLTVIYMGHNDIGRLGSPDNLGRSTTGYKDAVARLVKDGATSGNNRLFITQLHDWSKGPGVSDAAPYSQVRGWNKMLGELANATPNVIAVDMFTVFERIFEDPERFGFKNVTTANASRSSIDTLYNDATHFGSRGQDIIARVYQHYISRGWNWASTLAAGAETVSRLNQDIDNGTLVLTYADDTGKVAPGLRLLALGTDPVNGVFQGGRRHQSAFRLDDPAHERMGLRAPRGIALDFGSAGSGSGAGRTADGRMGLAFVQYGQDGRQSLASASDRVSNARHSSATAFYWHQPAGGLTFSTQLTRIDHQDLSHSADDILQLQSLNRTRGQSWAFEHKVRKALEWQGSRVTPWMSVGVQRHQLNPATLSSLYTSDVRFSSSASQYWLAGVGLDLQSPVIAIDGGHKLQLGGSLQHQTSLSRRSVQVFMQESANQLQQSEIFHQGRLQHTYLGLGAHMQLASGWRLRANYTADLQNITGASSVALLADLSF